MKYVKAVVLLFVVLAWCALFLELSVGYLPKRPDSAAYYFSQLLFMPGLLLANRKLLKVEERFHRFGEFLVAATFGALLITAVLFFLVVIELLRWQVADRDVGASPSETDV